MNLQNFKKTIAYKYLAMNFINNLSYKTLGTVSAIGLTACTWILYEVKLKKFELLKQTEIYKQAITALREHRGAIEYLGSPIKDGKILLNSADQLDNKTRLNEVTVNVVGPKSNGIMYFWVYQRLDKPGESVLGEVQLQIGSDRNKRLVVKHSSEPQNELSI